MRRPEAKASDAGGAGGTNGGPAPTMEPDSEWAPNRLRLGGSHQRSARARKSARSFPRFPGPLVLPKIPKRSQRPLRGRVVNTALEAVCSGKHLAPQQQIASDDDNRPTRKVLGARAHSGEWRRSRSVPIEEEQRRRAHAVSPQGARASQPRDCRFTPWTRPGTDDLLGEPEAVRGPETRSSLPGLDPDEWLVRALRGTTPRQKKIHRACNPLLETELMPPASSYARRGELCSLTREPSMSGT
jgi:hypothetical protein